MCINQMRSMHPVSPNRCRDNGRVHLDSIPQLCSGGRDAALDDGHELSEDDESRIADLNGDSGIGRSILGPPSTSENIHRQQPHPAPSAPLPPLPPPPPPAPPSQQQSSSSSVIRWERFLPFQSLKVLLVENDDSTRHVVTALLRNCSYEVISVANGVEAWKILEDLSNHVDIVLTEVVMPGLSGIGLLCKIINHKTCQNIPVIMMSSHDSMGIVFKCLSKGAVDFLIKPIRKNELKNLWQHVWRRCHSSSGSGSESGIQTQKSVKRRQAEESGSDSDNDHEYDHANVDLNMQDGSDNGSGTQSSWRKHSADIESLQPMSACNKLPEPYNSTCAQVIHPKTETLCNEWTTRNRNKDSLHEDSDFWIPGEPDNRPKLNPSENVCHSTLEPLIDIPRNNHNQNDACKEITRPSPQAAHTITTITGSVNHNKILNSKIEVLDGHTDISKYKDKTVSNMKGLPSVPLNTKKLTSFEESRTVTNDDQIVLMHSGLSAFARYKTYDASNQIIVGCLEKHSLTDNINSEARKLHLSKNSFANRGFNGNGNNNDMGSGNQKVSIKEPGNERPTIQTAINRSHSSAFYPVQKRNTSAQEVLPRKIKSFEANISTTVAQPRVVHHVELQHHSNCQHFHNVHNMQQPPPEHDEYAFKKIEPNVPQCGSSVFAGGMELNNANYSINGSASGSNHGSNALNCSSAVVNVGRVNIDDDSGLAEKCGFGGDNKDPSGSGSASGAEQNRNRQREATQNKFQQKRKGRCTDKKVRSQIRKKLAEQRSRVCGQFVRQPTCSQDNDSDS